VALSHKGSIRNALESVASAKLTRNRLSQRAKWRARFDLTVAGQDPVEMRLDFRAYDKALSETSPSQYHVLTAA